MGRCRTPLWAEADGRSGRTRGPDAPETSTGRPPTVRSRVSNRRPGWARGSGDRSPTGPKRRPRTSVGWSWPAPGSDCWADSASPAAWCAPAGASHGYIRQVRFRLIIPLRPSTTRAASDNLKVELDMCLHALAQDRLIAPLSRYAAAKQLDTPPVRRPRAQSPESLCVPALSAPSRESYRSYVTDLQCRMSEGKRFRKLVCSLF